jgi:hypothetical protein
VVFHFSDDALEIGLLVCDVFLVGLFQLCYLVLVLVFFFDEALEQTVVELVVSIERCDQMLDLFLVDGFSHFHSQLRVFSQFRKVLFHPVLDFGQLVL